MPGPRTIKAGLTRIADEIGNLISGASCSTLRATCRSACGGVADKETGFTLPPAIPYAWQRVELASAHGPRQTVWGLLQFAQPDPRLCLSGHP